MEIVDRVAEYSLMYGELVSGFHMVRDIFDYLMSHGFDKPVVFVRRSGSGSEMVVESTYVRPYPSVPMTLPGERYLLSIGFIDTEKRGDVIVQFVLNKFYKTVRIVFRNRVDLLVSRRFLLAVIGRNREYIEDA